jgi:hypothetical protein
MRAIGTRTQSLIVATALMLTATAWAQDFGATVDSNVKVESQTGFRKERPIVWGYIYNQRGMSATRVRILIEQLDSTGKTLGSQTVWVPGDLPRFGREYFEQPVPTADATYRVRVISLDWLVGGAGGG